MAKKHRKVSQAGNVTRKFTTELAKARHVVESLVSGIDPDDGEELSGNPILQRVGVLRALLTAQTAIELTEARAARRALLPSAVGAQWTSEEETRLVSAFQNGDPVEEIAKRHNRTIRAIEARLERLGLITADQRTAVTLPFSRN